MNLIFTNYYLLLGNTNTQFNILKQHRFNVKKGEFITSSSKWLSPNFYSKKPYYYLLFHFYCNKIRIRFLQVMYLWTIYTD